MSGTARLCFCAEAEEAEGASLITTELLMQVSKIDQICSWQAQVSQWLVRFPMLVEASK